MKPLVYLRADCSKEIGMGHITRTMAIGQGISTDFEVALFTREVPSGIRQKARESGIKLVELSNEDHLSEFLSFLKGQEVVILDNYFFTSDYQKKIKAKGSGLICIDDLHDKYFHADLVINHSPGVELSDYRMAPETRLLSGLDYALLRPQFLKENTKATSRKNIFSQLFICYGGSDPEGLTLKTITQTAETGLFEKMVVVVGDQFQKLPLLHELRSRIDFGLHQSVSENDISSLIKESSFAIVPSSSILLETIASGVPFLTGFFVKNQARLSDYFSKFSVGNFVSHEFGPADFEVNVEDYDKIFEMIDKKSMERIAQAIKDLSLELT